MQEKALEPGGGKWKEGIQSLLSSCYKIIINTMYFALSGGLCTQNQKLALTLHFGCGYNIPGRHARHVDQIDRAVSLPKEGKGGKASD